MEVCSAFRLMFPPSQLTPRFLNWKVEPGAFSVAHFSREPDPYSQNAVLDSRA